MIHYLPPIAAIATSPVVATLRVGDWYRFNFAGAPGGSGTFVGWTDFGWIVFADKEEQVRFYNPALLCTITPDSFDPERDRGPS